VPKVLVLVMGLNEYQGLENSSLGQKVLICASERFVSSAKNQSKAMWKLINKEMGNSQCNSDYTIKSGNELITSPQVVSDRFNTFFVEVIEDLLLQKNVLDQKKNRQFFVMECSKTMSLKSNVFTGFDEIPMLIVKRCLCYVIRPLVHIYNISLQTGIFPEMVKIAKIRPLFKKGDRQDMQNYRPISILTSFTKIFEKLIFKRLLSFLKSIMY
jgi:hypothetical protein